MATYSTVVSSDTTLLAAPSDGFIRVIGYQMTSAGNPGRVRLLSGSTEKTGVSSFSATGGGIQSPPTELGYFDCASGEALAISPTTSGVNIDVVIQYAVYGNIN